MSTKNQSQSVVHFRGEKISNSANALQAVPSETPQRAAFLNNRSQSAVNFGHEKIQIIPTASRSKSRNASPPFRTSLPFRSPAINKTPISAVSRTPKLPSYLLNVDPKFDTNRRPKNNAHNNSQKISTTTAQQSSSKALTPRRTSGLPSAYHKTIFGKKRTSTASPKSVVQKKKKSVAMQSSKFTNSNDALRKITMNHEPTKTLTSLQMANANSLHQNQISNGADLAPTVNDIRNLSTIQEITETSSQFLSKASILENTVSFLEEEAKIFLEQNCKCGKFESIVKEYLELKQKNGIARNEKADATVNADSTIIWFEEIEKLTQELTEAKVEAEKFRKVAENTAKEIKNFVFDLGEEKRASKPHIADREEPNLKVSTALEIYKNSQSEELLKLKEKLQQFDEEVQKRKEAEILYNQMKEHFGGISREKAELKKSNFQLSEKLEILKNEAASKNEEMTLMKDKLQHFDAIVQKRNEVEARCNQMKANWENLEKKNLESEQKLEAVKAEMEEKNAILKEEKRRAESCVVELQNVNFELTGELEILKNDEASKNKEILELKEQLQHLNTVDGNRIETETLVMRMKANLEKLEREKAELNQKLKDVNSHLIGIKNANDGTDEEKQYFKDQISALQNANLALSDELKAFKKDASESALIQQELMELKEKLRNFDDEVQKRIEAETLSNQIKFNFEQKLSELQAELNEAKENNVKAEQEKRRAKSRNADLQNINLILTGEIKTLKNGTASQNEELVALKERLQNLANANQTLNETQILRTNFEELDRERAKLEEQLEEIQIQLNGMKEKNAKLCKEKEGLKDEIANLQNANYELTAELGIFKNDANSQNEELAALKEKLGEFDDAIQKLDEAEARCNQMKANFIKLEKKNAELKQKLRDSNAKLEQEKLQHSAEIDQEMVEAETLRIQLKSITESFKKDKLDVKKENDAKIAEFDGIVKKKNEEIEKLKEERNQARILAGIGSDAESDATEMDVSDEQEIYIIDNDCPEDLEQQQNYLQLFESLAETDPRSQEMYIPSKFKAPKTYDYLLVPSEKWKFIENGAVSSGITIFAASKNYEIQMKFVGKHSNGYLFECPRCKEHTDAARMIGKAFLALTNGILQVKTGGHRPPCRRLLGFRGSNA